MKCIIIEDEPHALEHLEYLLTECNRNIKIIAKLDSVKTATEWLQNNSADLIFMDIQLGDDLSFSIFDNVEVKTPIIFTTSYNEFAIQAFKANGIYYILKPIDITELEIALDKYEFLYANIKNYPKLTNTLQSFQKRFLLQSGNTLISISSDDIAFFNVRGKHLFIITKSNNQFLFDSTLDAIENRLDPEKFFRINRQYILSMDSIQSMHNHSRGRVIIETEPPCKEELIVSIERANEFKNWLNR